MQRSRVYLDAGGAAPLSPRVAQALQAGFADGWADPARLGAESRRARALLDGSREAIATVVGVATESLHFAPSPHFAFQRLMSGIGAARRAHPRIVVSAIERDAVVHAAAFARPHGVEEVPVDAGGHIDLDALASAATDGAALVAIQHANQEIGTVQHLDAVAQLTVPAAIPLIVDATTSLGHADAPEHWDALVGHAADWGGPAGIAVVALRPQTRWLPAWPEGDDWAPGGVSVPLALAAAVALQEREEARQQTAQRLSGLIDTIRRQVATIDGVDVLGDPLERLPHIVTFSCLYVDGEALLAELDKAGFAVGSGSACASGTLEPSRVLASLGALTHGNVRIALHPGVTSADVDAFLAALPVAVATVRSRLGAPGARG